MLEDVDWTHAAEHMLVKHRISVQNANDALRDPARVLIVPDYNSRSGATARIIGFSHSAGDILTIIVLTAEGAEYGVNGWRSNDKDRRIYREEGTS